MYQTIATTSTTAFQHRLKYPLLFNNTACTHYNKWHHADKKLQGFTLIESLCTLAISAIMLSIATPHYKNHIQRAEMVSLNQTLYQSIAAGRLIAIKHHTTYTFCSLDKYNHCQIYWQDNASLFHDTNKDLIRQADEALIRSIPLNTQFHTLKLTRRYSRHIRFKANGYFGYFNSFQFCPKYNKHMGKKLIMNRTGRLRYASFSCP